MITNEEKVNDEVFVNGVMDSEEMGMDDEGKFFAAEMLREDIYSDVELCIAREYISNAIDEHRKYNVDRKVEVAMPSEDNGMMFFIRDFAKGLSKHDIFKIYGKYFKSTKNSGNNDIGGFGIGAKSAHAYCDLFVITSFFEGVKTIYNCVLEKNDRGFSVGRIYEVYSEPTDESGIEVAIQAKNFNINKKIEYVAGLFRNEVWLHKDGIKFSLPDEKVIFENEDFKYLDKENSSLLHPYYCGLCVSMGGMVYPVDKNQFGYDFHKYFLSGLILKMEIGDVLVHPSREALRYTDSVIEKIKNKLKSVEKYVKEYCDQCYSTYENNPLGILGYKNDILISKLFSLFFDKKEFLGREKYKLGVHSVFMRKNTRRNRSFFSNENEFYASLNFAASKDGKAFMYYCVGYLKASQLRYLKSLGEQAYNVITFCKQSCILDKFSMTREEFLAKYPFIGEDQLVEVPELKIQRSFGTGTRRKHFERIDKSCVDNEEELIIFPSYRNKIEFWMNGKHLSYPLNEFKEILKQKGIDVKSVVIANEKKINKILKSDGIKYGPDVFQKKVSEELENLKKDPIFKFANNENLEKKSKLRKFFDIIPPDIKIEDEEFNKKYLESHSSFKMVNSPNFLDMIDKISALRQFIDINDTFEEVNDKVIKSFEEKYPFHSFILNKFLKESHAFIYLDDVKKNMKTTLK